MAGVSVADALAGSARVALLESEAHPVPLTGRSAALFALNYGSPTFTALTRASAHFARAAGAISPTPLLHSRGARIWPMPAGRGFDRRGQADAGQRRRSEPLSPQAARAGAALRREYVAAAAYERDVYDIDVDAVSGFHPSAGRPA